MAGLEGSAGYQGPWMRSLSSSQRPTSSSACGLGLPSHLRLCSHSRLVIVHISQLSSSHWFPLSSLPLLLSLPVSPYMAPLCRAMFTLDSPSAYALPFTYNKPSPPLYLGADMSFPFLFIHSLLTFPFLLLFFSPFSLEKVPFPPVL